ncbi:hypothetical protein NHJ13734_002521 [Beauveria thailandica]
MATLHRFRQIEANDSWERSIRRPRFTWSLIQRCKRPLPRPPSSKHVMKGLLAIAWPACCNSHRAPHNGPKDQLSPKRSNEAPAPRNQLQGLEFMLTPVARYYWYNRFAPYLLVLREAASDME